MSSGYAKQFPIHFPRLGRRYRKKSCDTDQYNCIAWAMGECHRPWWPGSAPESYWPPDLPPDETIDNFIAAFRKLGYELCVGAHHELRFEKVALYADRHGVPTHAARLSWRGVWISKLGQNVDITHESVDALEAGIYGTVVQIMRRPWTVRRFAGAAIVRVRTSRWIKLRCLWNDLKCYLAG
jgi:hypothetical protein